MNTTSSHDHDLLDRQISLDPADVESEDLIDDRREVEDYANYRSLSASAVVSCALGVGSFMAFFGAWLAALPVAGLIMGVFALRRIASREDEIAGRVPAWLGVVISAVCLVGGQAWVWYSYATEVPPGHVRITYEELQPDSRVMNQIVPPSAQGFDGKRVFVKGYVLAGNQKDGIRTFILVRDQGDCCFGGNPKLTDRILVNLKSGQYFTYTNKVQKLAGLFHVKPGRAVDVAGDVVYQLADAELR